MLIKRNDVVCNKCNAVMSDEFLQAGKACRCDTECPCCNDVPKASYIVNLGVLFDSFRVHGFEVNAVYVDFVVNYPRLIVSLKDDYFKSNQAVELPHKFDVERSADSPPLLVRNFRLCDIGITDNMDEVDGMGDYAVVIHEAVRELVKWVNKFPVSL